MKFSQLRAVALIAATGLACARSDERDAPPTRQVAHAQSPRAVVCATPKQGIVITLDSIASLPTRAPLVELKRRCAAGETTLYDAVGWQAGAWTFPFTGARLMAVQSKNGLDGSGNDSTPTDLWAAEGDSLRLADGQLIPRTLGELRARYGQTIVDDNVRGDDMDGPSARSCRFPYVAFTLAVTDTARTVADSARITGVEMWVSPTDGANRLCSATPPADLSNRAQRH